MAALYTGPSDRYIGTNIRGMHALGNSFWGSFLTYVGLGMFVSECPVSNLGNISAVVTFYRLNFLKYKIGDSSDLCAVATSFSGNNIYRNGAFALREQKLTVFSY